jgi:rod shape-determining protein MreD
MAVGLPRRTLLQRLDLAAHEAAPAALTLVLVLVSFLPPLVPGQPGLLPSALPASVFFWTLYRPRLMAPPAVFGLGLVQDLLSAAPLGVNTLLSLLLHAAVLTQRRVLVRQSFLIVWVAFALLAAALLSLGWLLRSILAVAVLPPLPALVELGLVVFLYPAYSWLFIRLERSLAAP